MVEPHLPSSTVSTLRHLALFFLLGFGLFGLKRALGPQAPRPLLVVHVPAKASSEEIERAIDEAVLVDQGLARGGALLDPVVRDQILRSMRVSSSDTPAARARQGEADQELLERALSLGVHRADPLIRKRLAFQAEQLLRGRVHATPPTPVELENYLAEHAERYRKPARCSFAHAFVSRSRHPEDFEAVVSRTGQRLSAEKPAPGEAFRYSEPTILPLEISRATAAEIAARFGETFEQGLREAPVGSWVGPISSSYGDHFVRVVTREPAQLANVDELRTRLLADRDKDLKSAQVAREVRNLREGYRVEVRRATAN